MGFRMSALGALLSLAAILSGCFDDSGTSGGNVVKCKFQRMTDPTDDSKQIELCEDIDDMEYHIVPNAESQKLNSGENYAVTLVASSDTCGGSSCYTVTSASSLRIAQRTNMQSLGFAKMDILMVRCNFNDYPALGTESSTHDDHYGAQGLKTMLENAAYGRIKALPEDGKVVSVNMHTSTSQFAGCKYTALAKHAEQKVKEQLNIDPNSYTFKEFHFPKELSGCGWLGLAGVGCGHPSVLPNPGGCRSWYRHTGPLVIAHELGHNLGLSHASGPQSWGSQSGYIEYGDKQASMGNNFPYTSSFAAAARVSLGVLKQNIPGEAINYDGQSSDKTLCSISRGSISASVCDAVTIMIPASWNPPSRTSGKPGIKTFFVSYRGNEQWEYTQSTHQNKVYIHADRHSSWPQANAGTEVWGVLSVGQTYNQVQGYSIQFKSASNGVATVAITGAGGGQPPTQPPQGPTGQCSKSSAGACRDCVHQKDPWCATNNWDNVCESRCTSICQSSCQAPQTPPPTPAPAPTPAPPTNTGKSACDGNTAGPCKTCVEYLDSWCKGKAWDGACKQVCSKPTAYTNNKYCGSSCEATTKSSWGLL